MYIDNFYKGLFVCFVMMESESYDISVDFLRERDKGLLYVDTCGTNWVSAGKGTYKSGIAKMGKMKNVISALRERENFLATDGVLEEIVGSRDHYRECVRGIKHAIKNKYDEYVSNRGNVILVTDDSLRKHIGWLRVYNNLLSILKEGVRLYSPKRLMLDSDYVCDYVNKRNDDRKMNLSEVDRGVIVAAISSGHGSGVLSADASLMSVFVGSVRKFKLNDCFVCDSMNRKSYPVLWRDSRWHRD